jgi:hypothetical protein
MNEINFQNYFTDMNWVEKKMRNFKLQMLAAVIGSIAMVSALPSSAEETANPGQPPVHKTLSELINTLVEKGTISAEQGEALTQQLQSATSSSVAAPEAPVAPTTVRVPYVPEAVKNSIRDEIRIGLREDVVHDVLGQAQQERWGIPGVLPDWVDRIKIQGDIRVRHQSELYASDNSTNAYVDFSELNRAGGFGKTDYPWVNTTQDRHRERVRLRLGIDAKVDNDFMAGMRLATGNSGDPVSTNQTLGNYGRPYAVLVDQAYLRYKAVDLGGYNWMTVWGGRMPNPWVSTDLVWDPDLNFEGVASTYRTRIGGSDGISDVADAETTAFFTFGAFPLQEVALSSRDKWLLGAQLGGQWFAANQSNFTVALAYYDYRNIVGQRNTLDSKRTDFTAPDFMQKGNTLFDIRNDIDVSTDRWALASDYNEINLTMRADLANFSPVHVVLTGDYVKNIGFKETEVSALAGTSVSPRTKGYQVQLAVGWPQIAKPRDWRVSAAYKHLERDAVLDAFTDSDFHLGGTDAEGWIMGFEYGLMDKTALNVRWLSADAIDGPPLSVDVLQIDVSAKF